MVFKYAFITANQRVNNTCIRGEKQCRLCPYLFHSKVYFPDIGLALMIQPHPGIQFHHRFLHFLLWVDYKK